MSDVSYKVGQLVYVPSKDSLNVKVGQVTAITHTETLMGRTTSYTATFGDKHVDLGSLDYYVFTSLSEVRTHFENRAKVTVDKVMMTLENQQRTLFPEHKDNDVSGSPEE